VRPRELCSVPLTLPCQPAIMNAACRVAPATAAAAAAGVFGYAPDGAAPGRTAAVAAGGGGSAPKAAAVRDSSQFGGKVSLQRFARGELRRRRAAAARRARPGSLGARARKWRAFAQRVSDSKQRPTQAVQIVSAGGPRQPRSAPAPRAAPAGQVEASDDSSSQMDVRVPKVVHYADSQPDQARCAAEAALRSVMMQSRTRRPC
jgi:hypothetical protein